MHRIGKYDYWYVHIKCLTNISIWKFEETKFGFLKVIIIKE